MKIVKGSKWLKRDFMEQLEQLLEDNHVVEIDKLVDFEGKKQFVKNMLIREELAKAVNSDITQQLKIDRAKKAAALKEVKYQDKLQKEEDALKGIMGL